MPDHTISDLLGHSFPKLNKEDWSKVASREIQGNPSEKLMWATQDDLSFFAYYDTQDCENLAYLQTFEGQPADSRFAGPRAWLSLPKITVTSAEQANAVALNHLANGADGILFDLRLVNSVDINVLLDKIDWPYCNVSFFVTPATNPIETLLDFLQKKNYDVRSLTGTIFWENLPEDAMTIINALPALFNLQSLGLYIPPASPVKEISDALTKAASLVDTLTDKRVEKEIAWKNISLSFAAGRDFFLEVAKLKALRILLYQVAKAFDIKNYLPGDTQIQIRSERWMHEKFEPHSNMLRSTTAAISAVVGGCNSLSIEAEDENNPMMNRIARNVSNILREESHLDKVSDPTAGAYAIEAMVNKIAQAAWTDFQLRMK